MRSACFSSLRKKFNLHSASLWALDFAYVKQIKRVKLLEYFFLRLKAIDKIREMVNEQTDKSPTSFYEALEKSTQATKMHYTEEFDE